MISAVNSSLELDQIVNLALQTILKSLGPGFAGIVLLRDRRDRGLEIAGQQGLQADEVPTGVFVDECACGLVVETRMPIFEPDCPCLDCHGRLSAGSPHSHLIFPLIARQSVVGVCCLFCPPDFQIEIADLSLWQDIGKQFGKAVEDAGLHVQLQRQGNLLQVLYDVSKHLATSLDLEWVLSRVLELSISATDADDGSIFLLPTTEAPAPRILRRDLSVSEADRVIEQVVGQGLAGWVIRYRRGAIVSDTARDPRWLTFSDEPNPPGSVLAVPLIADDRALGVLTLDHPEKNHFHPSHLHVMTVIAHQAATEVEKARLYREVTHLAEVLEQRVEERTRELREARDQLIHAEKLAALGELAAGVAHEIGNPLQILQTYVEYLAAQAEPEDPILEFAEPIQESLQSIARLVAQLRDFSRPASGKRTSVDLNTVLGNVLRLAGKELAHSKIKVEESFALDAPKVVGDSRQLEQVFLNLLLNARDAMPGGGQLTIETFVREGKLHARFTDTGTGISPEDLPHILEPYFTTKEDRGTGLGLAICQRIVAQHGGEIDVVSQPDEGAQFTILLPTADDNCE
jgi:signal transduction histidine kinase